MWIFQQTTGKLFRRIADTMEYVATGYSGKGDGKNNPSMQNVSMVGVIPKGKWRIGKAFDHMTKGRVCMRLFPDANTNTFGRDGFMVHGDSIAHPGSASEGCVILPRDIRLLLSASTDKEFEVI